MAITFLTGTCVEKQYRYENRLAHKVAPFVDFAIGVALVIIGILGTQGVIPMSGSVSFALLGTGAAYAGLRLLGCLAKCKKQMRCTEKLFLFKAPEEVKYYEESQSPPPSFDQDSYSYSKQTTYSYGERTPTWMSGS